MNRTENRDICLDVPPESDEIRLDLFLSRQKIIGLSRSRIQTLIRQGMVKVNDSHSKPSHVLCPGDHVYVSIPAPAIHPLEPEKIEFNVVFEDSSLIVINKPPGLVVHPAPGHYTGTLVHGLLYHCRDLSGIGGILRPGIVHRLDKDTSGLIIVAKNDRSHGYLAGQFKSGQIEKVYLALVHGRPKESRGSIDLPIGRHPQKRKQMAVLESGGRAAVSLWNTVKEFKEDFSLLSVTIKTGRTHQIRVHLSHIGHPVVGDPLYGFGIRWWKKHFPCDNRSLVMPRRQMLHAGRLGFYHQEKDRFLVFEAPVPTDMKAIIDSLKEA